MAAAVIQKVPNNAVVSSTPATDFRAERGSTPTSPAGK
jgi:hypothetical protein